MVTINTEHYIRLLLLNAQGATPVLRETLHIFVKQTSNKTLGDFLLTFQGLFKTMKAKRILSEPEHNKLLQGSAVDINEWDTSLLCFVLLNCCTLQGKLNEFKCILQKEANNDLDTFVRLNKATIDTFKGNGISEEQYNIVFPANGIPTDIELWDMDLITFILINVCTGKVQKCVRQFRRILQTEVEIKISSLNLTNFLKSYEDQLRSAKAQGKLDESQLDGLYPSSGLIADIYKWDTNTLRIVVLNCTSSLSNQAVQATKKLRELRNKCLAHRDKAEMTNLEYINKSKDLIDAIDAIIINEKLPIKSESDKMIEELVDKPIEVKTALDILKNYYMKETTENRLIWNKLESIEPKLDIIKDKLQEIINEMNDLKSKLPEAEYSHQTEIRCVDILLVIKSVTELGRRNAEEIIQNAMSNAGDTSSEKMREAVLGVIKEIVIDGRTIVEIKRGSIIISIKCTSLKALHGLLKCVSNEDMKYHIKILSSAVSEIVEESIDITICMSEISVINACEDVIQTLSEYVSNTSSLRMTMRADTVADIQRMVEDFKGEAVKSQLQSLSEGLSTYLGEEINVDVVVPNMDSRANTTVTKTEREKGIRVQPILEKYQPMCVSSEQYSKIINYIFDESAYSENARQFRCKIGPAIEILANIPDKIGYTKIVGSNTEGTLISGFEFDCLTILIPDVSIDCNQVEAKTHSFIPKLCLTRGPFTPAGYTKLQVNSYKEPCQVKDIIDLKSHFFHKIYIDNKQNMFLSNHAKYEHDLRRNGPALTFEEHYLPNNIDTVLTYQSKTLPHEMGRWFDRPRPNNWPPKATREEFKSMGCCYVGVGHSNSQEQDIEWRITPIRQELHLMLNLTETQYRCYICLKSIKQYMIQAYCGECISSYHCKTALFYNIENNAYCIWQPRYLIHCVYECLKLLSKWVNEKYCPNYFIPEENLFERNLVNDHQLKKLQGVLAYLTTNICTDVPKMLLHFIGYSQCATAEIDSLTLELIKLLKFIRSTQDVSELIEQRFEIEKYIKFIKTNPFQALKLFKKMVCPYEINISLLLELLEQRLLHVNDIMAKSSCSKEKYNAQLPDKTPGVLEYCLKLATIAAARGEFIMCDEILQQLNGLLKGINVLCHCTFRSFEKYNAIKTQIENSVLVNTVIRQLTGNNLNKMSIQDILQHFTFCIEFYGNEMYIVAEPLSFEAYKSVGMYPIRVSSYALSEAGSISIHPTVYMHFLQYNNSLTLNKRCDAHLALNKLEHVNYVSLRVGFYSHPDTLLNILGHIYITKDWNRLAVQCFRRSLQMSYYNAAKWHVMFMLFR